jgi:dienelactone hydrolase
MRSGRRLWLLGVLAAGVAAWLIALPYLTAAAFILDLSGSSSWLRDVLPARAQPVTSRDLPVPTRDGPIAARLYTPAGDVSRSVVVFPGVHAGGVDEPRLSAFSTRLAATGTIVLSVPLPDLRQFRITTRSTDMIEDVTAWMAADRALAPGGRVGLVGVSFAGGLALVAAGRPRLSGIVQVVVSLGGYADLPRVMTYLCTGRLADGTLRPPHDYGVAVILLGAVDRMVPAAQAAPLAHALRTFLDASSLASTDPAGAQPLFDAARREGDALPEPARHLMAWVNDRNVGALGPVLLPFVEALGGAPALSPDRSPATHARVFLLQGVDDNVIPSTETPQLAAYLSAHGNAHVTWLLTPVLTHANLRPDVPAGDVWRLVRFWKQALQAASTPRLPPA